MKRSTFWVAMGLLSFQVHAQAPLPPGHPPSKNEGPPPSMEELIGRLDAQKDLKKQDKPFDVSFSIGKLYYQNGRLADALDYLKDAQRKTEPLRKLYVEQKKKAAALKQAVPKTCSIPPSSLEALSEKANQLAKGGDSAEAAACAFLALAPLQELEGFLSKTLVIQNNFEEALTSFERLLSVFESDVAGHYGRAMVLIETRGNDLASLRVAEKDIQRVLELAPHSYEARQLEPLKSWLPTVIAAGGVDAWAKKRDQDRGSTKGAPSNVAPPPLSQETMAAFQNAPRTADLMANLEKNIVAAESFLAQGQFQQALDNYKQVMPYQPQNGRVQAGMAWSLVKLNRQPMADRVWNVAVTSNAQEVAKLVETLKSKGDARGASELKSKLDASLSGP